jgi:hypothetical protein
MYHYWILSTNSNKMIASRIQIHTTWGTSARRLVPECLSSRPTERQSSTHLKTDPPSTFRKHSYKLQLIWYTLILDILTNTFATNVRCRAFRLSIIKLKESTSTSFNPCTSCYSAYTGLPTRLHVPVHFADISMLWIWGDYHPRHPHSLLGYRVFTFVQCL